MNYENEKKNRFQQKLESRTNSMRTLKVLVVDDDPSIVEVLDAALGALGDFHVTTATSADQAIDSIEGAQIPFDCLLLDIQMPDTDGIVLLRGIRALPGYAEIPIIMLTAMTERQYIDDAFLAGATDYVTKPFDLIELRGRMNAARRLAQAHIETENHRQSVLRLEHELDTTHRFKLDDAITIEDASRCLRYAEFNNYISQLSRSRRLNSYALGIKLMDARIIFGITNCTYFRRIVLSIAECLQSATSEVDYIFSYHGGGLFLVIVHEKMPSSRFPDEQRLNSSVGALLGDRKADAWINVLQGEPISMRSLSRNSAKSAVSRAIKSVENRESSPRTKMNALNKQKLDEATYGTKCEPSNRTYERALIELLGTEKHLNIR